MSCRFLWCQTPFPQTPFLDEANIDLPYMFLADFGRFFMNLLEEVGESDPVVQKTFATMNELLNDDATDQEVVNLLQIELCEILASSKKGIGLAEKLLHGKALQYFNMARGWLKPE